MSKNRVKSDMIDIEPKSYSVYVEGIEGNAYLVESDDMINYSRLPESGIPTKRYVKVMVEPPTKSENDDDTEE